MIKKTTLAYLAGYTDGDGCFHLAKTINKKTGNIKYRASFIVSSTNKDILIIFKKNFGGNYRLSSKKIITHKPQYQFSISGKHAVIMIDQILPFLVEKRKEAEIFINCVNTSSKDDKEVLYKQIKHIKNFENLVTRCHATELKNIKFSQTPSNENFSYFSGFIDAECCFSVTRYVSKNNHNYIYKIKITCNNTKFPIFKWMVERFGGSARFIDRRSKNIKHRDQLCWTVSSKELSNILPKIMEFIKQKKFVCEELMKFDKTTLTNGGARHTETFRASYAKILAERDLIFHKVHLLNLKGC